MHTSVFKLPALASVHFQSQIFTCLHRLSLVYYTEKTGPLKEASPFTPFGAPWGFLEEETAFLCSSRVLSLVVSLPARQDNGPLLSFTTPVT